MPKFLLPLVLAAALIISILYNFKLLSERNVKSQTATPSLPSQPSKQNLVLEKVDSVIDGDTFRIAGGRRVRLLGVNAPEIGKCLSNEAKNALEKEISGKEVQLTDQFTDPYGRVMANVFVGEGYINLMVIASGFARPDYTTNPRREELSAAYKTAREQKLGLSSGVCLSNSPENKKCSIKGNVDDDTQKRSYYLTSCKFYLQVQIDSSSEDQWFCSEGEAKEAGFTRAASCQ